MLAITDIDLALKRCRHTSIANDRLDFAFVYFQSTISVLSFFVCQTGLVNMAHMGLSGMVLILCMIVSPPLKPMYSFGK